MTGPKESLPSRCDHRPEPVYDEPRSMASAVLRPHRSYDWMRCRRCGSVGLRTRRAGRIEWKPPGSEAAVLATAAQYNAWNARIAETEGDGR